MKYLAIIVNLVGIVLCTYWFNWKLTLVIFIFLFGNNLDIWTELNKQVDVIKRTVDLLEKIIKR